MRNLLSISLLGFFILLSGWCHSQDGTVSSPQFSSAYINQVLVKANRLDKNLEKKSAKALKQWQRQEDRIKKKISKIDKSKATAFLENTKLQYSQLEERLQAGSAQQYIPSMDTMLSSLKFLQQNSSLLSGTKEAQQKLKEALGNVNDLQNSFQKAEIIKTFLKERKQYLKDQISQFGSRYAGRFTKELKHLNKQAFYFSQQISEYKSLLNDHKKRERKALEILSKTKLFRDFMKKNGLLASLFRLPGDPDDPLPEASLAGLQTRIQVNSLIEQQLSAGGPNAQRQFQQNIQSAQGQLSELKNKMIRMGDGSDAEMPEGFKPNYQKTKSFLQRLELGTNIQSQKANGYFPTTTDIGISLGYKLNDKSIIGVGASYKMGWGKSIRHITLTHQGMGLRSFADWKIKGSFWVSGGFEINHRAPLLVSPRGGEWQQSGLIGLSKVVSQKTKFFKKAKMQLLFDFFSYRQIPKSQPVIFRIGYSFK